MVPITGTDRAPCGSARARCCKGPLHHVCEAVSCRPAFEDGDRPAVTVGRPARKVLPDSDLIIAPPQVGGTGCLADHSGERRGVEVRPLPSGRRDAQCPVTPPSHRGEHRVLLHSLLDRGVQAPLWPTSEARGDTAVGQDVQRRRQAAVEDAVEGPPEVRHVQLRVTVDAVFHAVGPARHGVRQPPEEPFEPEDMLETILRRRHAVTALVHRRQSAADPLDTGSRTPGGVTTQEATSPLGQDHAIQEVHFRTVSSSAPPPAPGLGDALPGTRRSEQIRRSAMSGRFGVGLRSARSPRSRGRDASPRRVGPRVGSDEPAHQCQQPQRYCSGTTRPKRSHNACTSERSCASPSY